MKEELEGLILKLTTDFEKTIPQKENERTEIIEAFKNYLYLAVQTIEESTSKFISKDLESIKSFLNSIASDFDKKDMEYIKRNLLVDKSFEEIRGKSVQIFEMAKSIMLGKRENVEIDVATEIDNMENLLKGVKKCNQKQAEELISEAIVDLQYITHLNEDVLSLRLYHFKKQNERNKGVDR